jgi:membrane protein required for colicin V production
MLREVAGAQRDTDDFRDRIPVSLTKPNTREFSPMNNFDIVVSIALLAAIASGFKAGLLRSAVTILAYLFAMPIAVMIMSLVPTDGRAGSTVLQNSPLLFGVFLVTGIVLGKFLRMAVEDIVGPEAGLADRFAGAALGAVRIGLVAITLVLTYDRLASSGPQPAFLAGSQLRPLLSVVGQKGFNSLPPDLVAHIDRLKRDRRI